ncbi:MAG: two pore domain potassium channel family protein [Acidimicrobiia bacterium]|nr:two pore domain potassium channel family protein [Acidimicrobiia bacterium]
MSHVAAGPVADAAPEPRAGRTLWLLGLGAAVRILATTASLVALFYVLPLEPRRDVPPVALLVLALVAVALLAILQVRAIILSPLPRLRAVEALAASIPLLLVSFASCYVVMSDASPATFDQPVTRTDALYFTVTVFATVGFGDISPMTQWGRAAVTVQMVVDLVVVGFGLRVVTNAVELGRERRAATRNAGAGRPGPAPEPGGDAEQG